MNRLIPLLLLPTLCLADSSFYKYEERRQLALFSTIGPSCPLSDDDIYWLQSAAMLEENETHGGNAREGQPTLYTQVYCRKTGERYDYWTQTTLARIHIGTNEELILTRQIDNFGELGSGTREDMINAIADSVVEFIQAFKRANSDLETNE